MPTIRVAYLVLIVFSDCSVFTVGVAQGITAPIPDGGDTSVEFKLMQTIAYSGMGSAVYFSDSSARIYTSYVQNEVPGGDCRPCQSLELRNVVSGTVIRTVENRDRQIWDLSDNAGAALGITSVGVFSTYHISAESLSVIATLWERTESQTQDAWELDNSTVRFSADGKALLVSASVSRDESLARVWRVERGQ